MKITDLGPKRGDRVLVRDRESRRRNEVIYLATIEGASFPIICVNDGYEEQYKDGDAFLTCERRYMKSLEEEKTKELTMQELEEELGCKVKIVK